MTDRRPHILVVDDEPHNRELVEAMLTPEGYDVVCVEDGMAALRMVDAQPPDLILLDVMMPHVNGFEVCRRIKADPETARIPVVLLTALTDRASLERGLEAGAEDFLSKPVHKGELLLRVRNLIRLVTLERDLLEQTLQGSINVLTDVLAQVNPAAFGRSERVARLVEALASDCDETCSWQLNVAARLSQLGCVTVPESVLERMYEGCDLSESEKEMLRGYPRAGHDLLVKIPRLEAIAHAVSYQAKRYDGGGEPNDEVRREQIPLISRLLMVALEYDTLRSSGHNAAAALDEMCRREGWYDPAILESLRRHLASELEVEVIEVSVFDLEPGMVLADDVHTRDGKMLVARDTRITGAMVDRLVNWDRIGGVAQPVQVLVDS